MTPPPPDYRLRGLAIAAAALAAWLMLLLAALNGALPAQDTAWGAPLWLLAQTFAYTGVFITAHDAMHGLVAPRHPRLNHAIGRLALWLFAAMDYHALRRAHHHHHATPSTAHDPDFHEPPGGGFWRWYLGFVRQYLTWRQLLGMALAFNALHHLADIPLGRLWLCWIAPQVLSTIQLFLFGTWLPHRDHGPYEGDGPTRARSVALPPWLSLLTCYHFGYHWEHHAWPAVPWWRLPAARRARLQEGRASGDGAAGPLQSAR
jgi:beta-carotene ketolase (CrtW type)